MGGCSAIRLQGQTLAVTELNHLGISSEKSIVAAFLALLPFSKWENKQQEGLSYAFLSGDIQKKESH